MKRIFLSLCLGCISHIYVNGTALPTPIDSLTFFEYLQKESIAEISLETDFSKLQKDLNSAEYQPTLLSYTKADGTKQSIEAGLKPRGKTRKKVCKYPPLKLKLPKESLKDLGLNSEQKYKLVCQCKKGTLYNQLILKEFLAYKLYNIITPYSFQVHLVKINFINTKNGKINQQFAFIIEPIASLAKRNKSQAIVITEDANNNLDAQMTINMSMFQYLIGNADWGIQFMHNVKLLQSANNKALLPVPYDFDFSGLVNAPYAKPNPIFPANCVQDRHFFARGCNEVALRKSIQLFVDHETEIINTVANMPHLDKACIRAINNYFKAFFELIKDEKAIKKAFHSSSK